MCIAPLVRHLLAAGESPRDVEDRIGASLAAIERPSTRIPLSRVFGLWAAAATRLGDATLPVTLARGATPDSAHLLGFVAQTAPSARAAVDALLDFGALHTNSGSWSLSLEGNSAILRWQRPGALTLGHRLCNEVVLTRYVGGLRCVVGDSSLPVRAWLRHSPGKGRRALEDFFGNKLECGADHDGFSFARDALEATPPQANAELWRFVRTMAEEEVTRIGAPCTAAVVRDELRAALARGDDPPPNSASVARRIGLSERSLRRQLARSDTSFRQIFDEVRRENARKLLDQHGRTISEVAFASGYSDVSAFDHAFQRWFGRSPRAYRAERRRPS